MASFKYWSHSFINIYFIYNLINYIFIFFIFINIIKMSSYFSLNFGDGTSIRDNSNNELLTFDVNATAVNNLEITNNAAGSNVSLNVIGSDTDIGLNLNPKGHGKVNILGSTSNAGGIRFYGNGATDDSTYVGLTANTNVASDISFVLPSSDGTSGQVLQTDGVGNLSFTDAGSGTPGGADTQIQFNSSGSFGGISTFTTNGTNLTLSAGNQFIFGDAGENIVGDGADLYVNSSNSINLAPSANVTITSGKNLEFGVGSGENISGDGTDLTIASGADINLTATADINIPANIGLTFGDDGEKIEGDGSNLTVNSGRSILLTATSNVIIPSSVPLSFSTDDAEKITGDGTDLTIASGNLLNLTPGSASNVVITQGSLVLSTSAAITSASTTEGSPTLLAPVQCVSLYNLSGAGTAHYVSVDGQPCTNGQFWNILFDVSSGTPSLRIDFGLAGLATGSGDAQYLTFNTGGQSASLIYHTNKWRIINTGAAVS